jgi:hypothetical protein
MFEVYGDYGYTSETLLEEFASFDEAVYWVERYVGDGDFGGHEIIEVAEFDDNGEYVVLMRWDADDYRDETVWDQEDDNAMDWEF